MLTSDALIKSIYRDELPDLPVLVDYFGYPHNNPSMEIDGVYVATIIMGVYVDLIKILGVKSAQLHKALIEGRLDKFIHEQYAKHGKQSGYYQKFLKAQIKVQQSFIPLN